MAGRLKGKVAFVTAAGQGIGRAIAEAFVAEGATVIATDLDRKKLRGLRRAERMALDVCSTEAVEAAAKEVARNFSAIDGLANCSGFVHHGSVLEYSDAEWDLSFDLNVKSMQRTIRAFLPGMLKKKQGSTINIASVASSISGLPNRYVYGASRAVMIGLTKSIAADIIKRGVRANAICPSIVQSPSPLTSASPRSPSRRASRSRRFDKPSLIASRWEGWERRRKSQPSPSILPPTSRRLRRGQFISSTAALRSGIRRGMAEAGGD